MKLTLYKSVISLLFVIGVVIINSTAVAQEATSSSNCIVWKSTSKTSCGVVCKTGTDNLLGAVNSGTDSSVTPNLTFYVCRYNVRTYGKRAGWNEKTACNTAFGGSGTYKETYECLCYAKCEEINSTGEERNVTGGAKYKRLR